ncbi:hypothetical protein [Lutibacter sp.]|uniref:hypothetical protein n=1 Tax=Lutibacter sp. TaxID=1925666 RepID=UPI0035681E67
MKDSYPLLLVLILFCVSLQGYTQNTILLPKTTVVPLIDGVLGEEWKDSQSVSIHISPNWSIAVNYKYDVAYLYIAFENLVSTEGLRVTPEILIATNIAANKSWNTDTYWFHSSYSNCEGIGEFYNWENCANIHPDWQANILPFKNGNNNIEFKISWAKLQINPSANLNIGIAFKLSNALEKQFYWPKLATISSPVNWGVLKF